MGRGASGGRGGSSGSTGYGFQVGQTISIDGYQISGGYVTTPSGRRQEIQTFRELTQTEKEQAARLGVKDPVLSGRMALPREVAQRAILQRSQEQEALQRNVPGLQELRAARASDAAERERFRQSVYGGSGRLQGNPASDSAKALEQRYPRAAAYLHAESWSYSRDDVKATLGIKAKNDIASGKPYKTVIDEMEKKWKRHISGGRD